LSYDRGVTDHPFERARSVDAKDQRRRAILDSAAALARQHGIRAVTLTDIAAGVEMHKSTMLRYFETREEIFLRLSQSAWTEWSAAVTEELDAARPDARVVAAVLASSLVARPLFCDLLAQGPMNLERGVALETVREFKLDVLAAVARAATSVAAATGLTAPAAHDVVATATAMAGALWQMAAPGTDVRRLYESDPALAHAVVDVEPRLTTILSALIDGSPAA
jgi:AcrR family transcriptional regulator